MTRNRRKSVAKGGSRKESIGSSQTAPAHGVVRRRQHRAFVEAQNPDRGVGRGGDRGRSCPRTPSHQEC